MPIADHTAEVEEAINVALARSAVAVPVVIQGTTAELRGPESVVAVELGEWVKQWPLLPPDIRARKVNDAARRIRDAATGKRGSTGGGPKLPMAGRVRHGLSIAVVLLLVLAGIHWLRQSNFFGSVREAPEPADSGATAEQASSAQDEQAIEERAQRVCDVARRRLLGGGSMAGFDVAGWEVVLWLSRRQPEPDWSATLATRVDDGQLAREARDALGLDGHGTLRLAAADGSRAVRGAPGSVAMRFGGAFAAALFDPAVRRRLVTLVAHWAQREQADFAALYGTCAHLDTADVGVWYAGRDPVAAVASLLYAAGLCAASPPLDRRELPGAGDTLTRLEALARRLEPQRIDDVFSTTGGVVESAEHNPPGDSGLAGLGSTIRFPVGGPIRASAASRLLLRSKASSTKPE